MSSITGSPPTIQEIAGWLRLLVEPGGVVEFRALGVLDNPKYPPFTVAGYFDADHLEQMAGCCTAWTGKAEGVYLTINPVDPGLLALANNQVVRRAKSTASDGHILRRRWIVFDSDPARRSAETGLPLPPGISATDAEKTLAHDRLLALVADLTGSGWPEPILADSGNGLHAWYRVELPADDGGLMERALKAANARHGDELVKIDTALFNPARIIKLYGSMARKGDETPERPHRWTRLLSAPGEVQVVPRELIEELGALAPAPASTPRAAETNAVWSIPVGGAATRARSYVFAAGFPNSIAGQNGHGTLYRVACTLVDGFGLPYDDAMPIFREWNEAKAEPPESEEQLEHKLRDAMKANPVPSCRLLSRPDPRRISPATPSGAPTTPALPPGTWVHAKDQDNYGEVVEDQGDHARVHFVSPSGYEATVRLHKSLLEPADGSASAEPAPEPWPPLRLAEPPEAFPWPLDVFPEPVARFVDEVAESVGCAPDFPAMQCLAVAAGVIGRSASLLLKPGYFARASIYAACVGPVSDGKSPSLAMTLAPILTIDRALEALYRKTHAAWEATGQQSDKRGKPNGPPPRPGRIDVENFTLEKLFEVLADNPLGLLSRHDELSSLLAGLNQYRAGGKGNDREHLLSIWSGTAFKFDRKSLGAPPLRVPDPCLSIIGGIQDTRLRNLGFHTGDGLVERFVFAFPAPRPLPEWSERGVDEAVADGWASIINGLWAGGASVREGGATPQVVHLTNCGRRAWEEHYRAHIAEMNDRDFEDGLRGAWGKFREYPGRFALVLALLRAAAAGERGLPEIDAATVEQAWRLTDYFKASTRRVRFVATGGGLGVEAQSVLEWIGRHQRSTFRVADLTAHLRRFRGDAVAQGRALHALELVGAIRLLAQRPHGRGRRPSDAYEVHPDLVHAPENSVNSGNPSSTEDRPPEPGPIAEFSEFPGAGSDEIPASGREVIDL